MPRGMLRMPKMRVKLGKSWAWRKTDNLWVPGRFQITQPSSAAVANVSHNLSDIRPRINSNIPMKLGARRASCGKIQL